MESVKQWRGYFKTQAVFDAKLAAGEIDENVIYFIGDKQIIWTRGKFFSLSPQAYSSLDSRISSIYHEPKFTKLSDGTTTVQSPDNEGTIKFNKTDGVNVSVSANGVTIGADIDYLKQVITPAVTEVADALIFKGTLGEGGTITSLPTTDVKVGWTYKVATAGTYGDHVCEVGDMIICLTDGDNVAWCVVQGNIDDAATKQYVDDANAWMEFD